jgi:hypothetical protein
MFGIGLQIFALVAIGLTILLAAYALYVRIRSSTYTERKFSFVALWSCATVMSAAFLSVTDVQLLSIAVGWLGIKLDVTTLPEKALIVLLAISYCYIVRGWSLGWHGLLTEQGRKNRDRGRPQPFITEGLAETIRILKRQPPLQLESNVQNDDRRLALGAPIDELPLQEQIRLLVQAKWPEYEIFEENWVGEVACWLGRDRAYDRPIFLACGENASQFNLTPLTDLTNRKIGPAGVRVLFVFRILRNDFQITVRKLNDKCDVEILSLDELVENVANFDEYRRCIEVEFKQKHLPDASFAIFDVLAPTRVRVGLAQPALEFDDTEKEETKPSRDFGELTVEWLKDGSSTKHLALLGEYGQGKSTAALALTYNLLFDLELRRQCLHRIPILIRLTGRSPSTARLAEMLGAWGSQYNLSGQVLLALHRAGRLLLIFDAFDEMAHVMDRTARFEHFDALWEFASGGAKLLFTGRPNFFLDDEELKEVLGIAKNTAIGPYCEAVRVVPFGIEQIETAVKWLKEDKRVTLIQAVSSSSALREVCCRPSLLYLIAHLWDRDRLDLHSADVNSAGIVLEFIAYSLERQVQKQKDDAARRVERQFLSLTKSELHYFTSGIAVASLTEGRQNSIPKDVFETRIRELYEKIPQASLKSGMDEVRSLAIPMKARFSDLPNPIEACVHAVRTHGVIEHDVSRSRHYRFSHKSFCEVLAAEVLKNSILLDDNVSAAIELANSTPLIELADQPQIVEFVADFLASGGPGMKALSYVDVYRKVFPSRFQQDILVRFRSLLSAVIFLGRYNSRFRVFTLFLMLMATFSVVYVSFSPVLRAVFLMDSPAAFSRSVRDVSFYLVSGLLSLFMIMFIQSTLMDARNNLSKFNFVWRLCSLFEKTGLAIYPTSVERHAHRRASEILSSLRNRDADFRRSRLS